MQIFQNAYKAPSILAVATQLTPQVLESNELMAVAVLPKKILSHFGHASCKSFAKCNLTCPNDLPEDLLQPGGSLFNSRKLEIGRPNINTLNGNWFDQEALDQIRT